MKYLLDTCLVSELVKKEPNPAVVSWLDEQDEQKLCPRLQKVVQD